MCPPPALPLLPLPQCHKVVTVDPSDIVNEEEVVAETIEVAMAAAVGGGNDSGGGGDGGDGDGGGDDGGGGGGVHNPRSKDTHLPSTIHTILAILSKWVKRPPSSVLSALLGH